MEHKFDNVTRFCIYCNMALADYRNTGKPCIRIMEPDE